MTRTFTFLEGDLSHCHWVATPFLLVNNTPFRDGMYHKPTGQTYRPYWKALVWSLLADGKLCATIERLQQKKNVLDTK